MQKILTRREVAKIMGVAYPTLQSYMRRKNRPLKFEKIGEWYHVTTPAELKEWLLAEKANQFADKRISKFNVIRALKIVEKYFHKTKENS